MAVPDEAEAETTSEKSSARCYGRTLLWAHAQMAGAGRLALRGTQGGVPQRESEGLESEGLESEGQ